MAKVKRKETRKEKFAKGKQPPKVSKYAAKQRNKEQADDN